MSWNTLDPNDRAALERTLTRKQLDVLKLHLAGCGSRRISDMLSISRTTAKDHIRKGTTALAELQRKAPA